MECFDERSFENHKNIHYELLRRCDQNLEQKSLNPSGDYPNFRGQQIDCADFELWPPCSDFFSSFLLETSETPFQS